MKVLVINCGSSSLKYQLIDMENESVLAKGICGENGSRGSVLTHRGRRKRQICDRAANAGSQRSCQTGNRCTAGSGAWCDRERR